MVFRRMLASRPMSPKAAAIVALFRWYFMAPARPASAVGWYLMQPPSEARLDASCQEGGSWLWHDYWTALCTRTTQARLRRCAYESVVLAHGNALALDPTPRPIGPIIFVRQCLC